MKIFGRDEPSTEDAPLKDIFQYALERAFAEGVDFCLRNKKLIPDDKLELDAPEWDEFVMGVMETCPRVPEHLRFIISAYWDEGIKQRLDWVANDIGETCADAAHKKLLEVMK